MLEDWGEGENEEPLSIPTMSLPQRRSSLASSIENVVEDILEHTHDDDQSIKDSKGSISLSGNPSTSNLLEVEKPLYEPEDDSSIGVMLRLFWYHFRKTIQSIVSHVFFDRIILVFIAMSSILMAMSDYTHVDEENNLVSDGSRINLVILECEIVFTVVFLLEFVLKLIALGRLIN